MRVHVISDMEGVAGIDKWDQCSPGEPEYPEARRLYTEEVNAAVRGAKAAGATEIVVMDMHGGGRMHNLIPDELDPDCDYVVQEQPTYVEFLEQGCDAALVVGMHARAGTEEGVLAHTFSLTWRNLWLNGRLVGETALLGAICGTWGCPVLLVTGDQTACWQSTEELGSGLTTVVVKRGFGTLSARHVAPLRARRMIEDGAREALRDLRAVAPYDPGRPCEIRVEYTEASLADEHARRPGVEAEGDTIVASRADDFWSAWRQFFLD